jgi:hypothetical protein
VQVPACCSIRSSSSICCTDDLLHQDGLPPQLLRDVVEEIQAMDREGLKDMLASLADKVVLDLAHFWSAGSITGSGSRAGIEWRPHGDLLLMRVSSFSR